MRKDKAFGLKCPHCAKAQNNVDILRAALVALLNQHGGRSQAGDEARAALIKTGGMP